MFIYINIYKPTANQVMRVLAVLGYLGIQSNLILMVMFKGAATFG